MSEEVQFNLRIPAVLKQQIVDAAKKHSRSINAEAQLRLEATFENDDHVNDLTDRVELLEKNLQKVMQELRMYDPNKRD